MPALISHHSVPSTKTKIQHLNDISLLRQYLGLEKKKDSAPGSNVAVDPVFIAIDLEAYERDQSKITEVGLAMLDSRHLAACPPESSHVSSWLKKIRSRHFIIKQYKNLLNRKHVKGCPMNFLFGESQFISRFDANKILKQIFTIKDSAPPSNPDEKKTRPVILVGHDIQGDIVYLRKLGFSIDRTEIINVTDTQKIARSITLPIGLSKLSSALGQNPLYLHNAGNDATYTMQSLLLMALYGHELPEPDSLKLARDDVLRREKVELAFQEAARELREAKKEIEARKLAEEAKLCELAKRLEEVRSMMEAEGDRKREEEKARKLAEKLEEEARSTMKAEEDKKLKVAKQEARRIAKEKGNERLEPLKLARRQAAKEEKEQVRMEARKIFKKNAKQPQLAEELGEVSGTTGDGAARKKLRQAAKAEKTHAWREAKKIVKEAKRQARVE